MSLCGVSDAFLGRRAAEGDDIAFAELARRYRPLITRACRVPVRGVDVEDARQEALLGLLKACREHDPARGSFAAFARVCVRSKVAHARVSARAGKHRILTDALRDGDEPTHQLQERTAAGAGSDPAVVVELRDELRQRAQRRRRRDLRRRYSDEQITGALALIAQGKTIKQAAHAVGAPCDAVNRWLKRAGQQRVAGRRYYSGGEISRALALVEGGASLRQAAAAVGASSASVLRWARQAAA